jgi:hypothetical protein
MNTEIISLIIFGCVAGAVLIGRTLARLLPEDNLSADTKETVKLAMGLLATMSALLLGLLVASAKGSYDKARSDVIQMAAKVVFLDRVLAGYGPETAETRAQLRDAVEELAHRSMQLPQANRRFILAPNTQSGNAIYLAIQHLTPHDDMHQSCRCYRVARGKQAKTCKDHYKPAYQHTQQRLRNGRDRFCDKQGAKLAQLHRECRRLGLEVALQSALSAAAAIFLILELDRPFGGVLGISKEPMLNVLSELTPGRP